MMGGWAGMGGLAGLGWGGMLLWVIVWGVFLGLIAAGLVWLLQPRTSQETPLETLKRRYARGEVTRGEYDDARRTLA